MIKRILSKPKFNFLYYILETFFFLVVSLTLFTTQCFAGKCPKPEVLSPCSCYSVIINKLAITCNTDETVDIKKILTKVSEDPDAVNTVFDHLFLERANITEFPEGATGKLKFKSLIIGSDVKSLQRIHSKAFASSQDTMVYFNVFTTSVTNGPAPYSLVDLINSFPKLNSLHLNPLIDTIQDGSLSINLTNLIDIDLRVNAIKGSPFANLISLEVIALTGESLNHIPFNSFKIEHKEANNGKPLYIFLNQNPLNGSSFELGAFTHPSLNKRNISLQLVSNNITFLNETVFLPFLQNENNKFEVILDNPLDCDDCRTAWICKKLSANTRSKLDNNVQCKGGHRLGDCDANFKKCK
jgi:hypothetical protein